MRRLLQMIATGMACVAFQWGASAGAWASSLDAEHEPKRPVVEDEALLQKGRIHAQQKALVRLGDQTDSAADKVLLEQLDRYEAGDLPAELWLELWEAAAKRSNLEIKARVAKHQGEVDQSGDPLYRFRECLKGGDGEAGRQIFAKKPEAGCIRCHSVNGEGGQIGPELVWLRHSAERMNILESIILPNAVIAPGYASALLKLKGGEEISGVMQQENAHDVTVTSVVDGKKRKVLIEDIVERTPLPSPMPPAFGLILSKREIRDLVEFIAAGE
ncbi:heme-binding protein [Chthoniobacter flavus Ellin428]|uniref:Heme-binding protein n=1 Tax=Chthoniobacter flavus Ellin428 TaxID=497964 RepID=B4DAE7_9BACT|nr:c-type cytochrome [Chthoniobacter flavus]EDY16608.1 heme-binding protein [Chthoniobacter flavus Ellin428]TCO91973.1 putative heme-binding domain-containing protein [Chthoniobacter flavus]